MWIFGGELNPKRLELLSELVPQVRLIALLVNPDRPRAGAAQAMSSMQEAARAKGVQLHYLPLLYRWNVRRRLLYWYARLQALEASINSNPGGMKNSAEVQNEFQRIEDAVSHIHFPLGFSDQVYNLRSHIEIVRRRATGRENLSLAAE